MVESRNEIILAVHRALVETYALKEAGLPLVMDYSSLDPANDYAERVAGGAKFEQDANGEMALVLESEELRQSILDCVTPQAPSRDNSAMGDLEIEEEEISEEMKDEEMESREAEEMSPQMVEEDDKNSLEFEGSEPPIPDEEYFDPASPEDRATFMPASDTWRDVSLEDAAIKFAVSGP